MCSLPLLLGWRNSSEKGNYDRRRPHRIDPADPHRLHALREEQVRQAGELTQIKTTVYRIEQNLKRVHGYA